MDINDSLLALFSVFYGECVDYIWFGAFNRDLFARSNIWKFLTHHDQERYCGHWNWLSKFPFSTWSVLEYIIHNYPIDYFGKMQYCSNMNNGLFNPLYCIPHSYTDIWDTTDGYGFRKKAPVVHYWVKVNIIQLLEILNIEFLLIDETGELFSSLEKVPDKEKLIGFKLTGLATIDVSLSCDELNILCESSMLPGVPLEDIDLCFSDDFLVAKRLVRADKRDLQMYPYPSSDCAVQYYKNYYQEVKELNHFTKDDLKYIRWKIHSVVGSLYMDRKKWEQQNNMEWILGHIKRVGTVSSESHAIRAEFESTPETTISALTERWKDCCHKDGLCSCPETSDYLEMLKLYDE